MHPSCAVGGLLLALPFWGHAHAIETSLCLPILPLDREFSNTSYPTAYRIGGPLQSRRGAAAEFVHKRDQTASICRERRPASHPDGRVKEDGTPFILQRACSFQVGVPNGVFLAAADKMERWRRSDLTRTCRHTFSAGGGCPGEAAFHPKSCDQSVFS